MKLELCNYLCGETHLSFIVFMMHTSLLLSNLLCDTWVVSIIIIRIHSYLQSRRPSMRRLIDPWTWVLRREECVDYIYAFNSWSHSSDFKADLTARCKRVYSLPHCLIPLFLSRSEVLNEAFFPLDPHSWDSFCVRLDAEGWREKEVFFRCDLLSLLRCCCCQDEDWSSSTDAS